MIKETAFDKYSNIFIRIMFWIVIIIYIVFMGYTTTDAYRLEFAGYYLVDHLFIYAFLLLLIQVLGLILFEYHIKYHRLKNENEYLKRTINKELKNEKYI